MKISCTVKMVLMSCEIEIAIATFEKHKSPGSDQILSELIQAGGKILLSVIHKLINYI
jgi:hypothetical protein